MSAEVAVAAMVLAGVVAYAVFGGADFGGGVWDLFASGPRRAEQRQAIARAMGPVWEANHVWLIFVIVLLATAFPSGYASLTQALFVPFHLALVGIVLRGTAFVFRAYGPHRDKFDRPTGALFGASSAVTPVLLGMCLGAVSSGRIRLIDGRVIQSGVAWASPMAVALGLFALAICAYVAAVYLTLETSDALREDFRNRAIASGTVVVALSVAVLPIVRHEAPAFWTRLLSARSVPLFAAGVAAALTSGAALRVRAYRVARLATIVQVTCLLTGWGAANYPYLVAPDIDVHTAAAPAATLRFVLFAVPIGLCVLLPSLAYLFRVFKRSSVA